LRQPQDRERFLLGRGVLRLLLGFHSRREVGVDVEQRRPVPEWQDIARRCLPPERQRRILELPAERRPDAFLLKWCLLEAHQKAKGLGLYGRQEAPPASAGHAGPEAATEAPPSLHQWPALLPQGYLGAAALA
jgi:4'-phosphopantetheinyl transferase